MASKIKCLECGSRFFNKVSITSVDTCQDEHGSNYEEQKELISMLYVENGLLNWENVELFVYSCEMCNRIVCYTEEKEVETMEEEKERESIITWDL